VRAAAFAPNRLDAFHAPAVWVGNAICGPPQHFLYFYPLPQGQGSFLPVGPISVRIVPQLIPNCRSWPH